jgi:hypothetical protein
MQISIARSELPLLARPWSLPKWAALPPSLVPPAFCFIRRRSSFRQVFRFSAVWLFFVGFGRFSVAFGRSVSLRRRWGLVGTIRQLSCWSLEFVLRYEHECTQL